LNTKEPNREILGNQQAMYKAVKALKTKTSLIKFSFILMQQNFILLPTYVLCEAPLLPGISNRSNNTVKLATMQLWSLRT
jgi:hypothetical protein